MQNIINKKNWNTAYILVFLAIFFSQLIFGVTTEKVYVGLKYSFRNYKTNGDVILIDPFSKTMVIYGLESKKIMSFYNQIGSFVIAVYDLKDSHIIVDRTAPAIYKKSLNGEVIASVKFDRRIQSSVYVNDTIYILLEGGQLFVYDKDLKLIFKSSFSGSPAYLFIWKGKVLATYLWNNSYDVEFLGEKPYKIGLTTPALLVEDLLIDTRGGQVYNLSNKKTTRIAPYISSAYFDGTFYYIASMSNSAIYILREDDMVGSFSVPYTPTYVSKVGNYIVILSAPYNKVMVTENGKDILTFDTGDYPIEVFKLFNDTNSFAVYCSDSGEMYYYYF